MKKLSAYLCLSLIGACLAAASVQAGEAKNYQVTGPVLEVNATYIVVQKGDEKWQIAVEKNTKGSDVKVGDKVTVQYQMVAKEIETKPAKGASADKLEKKS